MSHRQTKAQMLRRRRRVEELLADGMESSVAIAERLAAEGIKIGDRTIREDIAAIGRDWHAAIVSLRHVRQMRKVRDADWRSSELRAEWERSKLDKQRQRAKEVKGGGEDGAGSRTETEAATEGRLGDPAYLTEVRKNDELVAQLLGLEEPKRIAPTNSAGDGPAELLHLFSIEDMAAADQKLEAWKQARTKPPDPQTPEPTL